MFEEPAGLAKNYALKLLSFRPRSISEVRLKLDAFLKKHNFTSSISETVIADLKKLNFLNDEEFSRWWVEQRGKNSIRGERIIKIELSRKGVAREIIEGVLSSNNVSESEKALVILKNYSRKLSDSLTIYEKKSKLFGVLIRRGFDYETAKTAIDVYLKKV